MELAKLKKIRKNSNYSVQEMSDWLGISKPYYWQIENGQRNLYYKLAIKIAKIFKKKPDEIFYDDLKKMK